MSKQDWSGRKSWVTNNDNDKKEREKENEINKRLLTDKLSRTNPQQNPNKEEK